MRLKIDRMNDAPYLCLDEAEILESEEVQPGVILDFDKDNNVVSIEILSLSSRVSPEKLRVIQVDGDNGDRMSITFLKAKVIIPERPKKSRECEFLVDSGAVYSGCPRAS